jgi:hypothetical protein
VRKAGSAIPSRAPPIILSPEDKRQGSAPSGVSIIHSGTAASSIDAGGDIVRDFVRDVIVTHEDVDLQHLLSDAQLGELSSIAEDASFGWFSLSIGVAMGFAQNLYNTVVYTQDNKAVEIRDLFFAAISLACFVAAGITFVSFWKNKKRRNKFLAYIRSRKRFRITAKEENNDTA